MTNTEFKETLINLLYARGEYIKQVNPVEYRMRCPFCGDSSNPNTGHLYMRINPSDNFVIVYNCFRCPAFGHLTPDVLHLLGIDDPSIKGNLMQLNQTAENIDTRNLYGESTFQFFDYRLPEIHRGRKTEYIENRLGIHLTDQDLSEIKVITSLKEFLQFNDIHELMTNPYICNIIERDYVGFLSFGNSHIFFRDITDTNQYAWIKYPITKESQNNKVFYATQVAVNMIINEPITLNLSEGIMDIVSAKYNLGYSGENVINIAVGSFYFNRILLFLLDLGLAGSNVTVNIFADNDAVFNKKARIKTDIPYFQRTLGHMKYLYGAIYIYQNQVYKDIGTSKDNIKLKRTKL